LEKSNKTLPEESAVSITISYTKNQLPKLIRYLDNGRLNIDNNRAEREIKSFVIGRKALLYANTQNAATASATL